MRARKHHIVALVGVLERRVAGVVDEVDVVAGPAHHEVDAAAAVEEVVAAVAVDHVRLAVAVALQVGAALQDQVFDIRRQPEVGGRKNCVRSSTAVLDHDVAYIVHEVEIIAAPADHGIGAGAAIDQVAAGIADDGVREDVAVAL